MKMTRFSLYTTIVAMIVALSGCSGTTIQPNSRVSSESAQDSSSIVSQDTSSITETRVKANGELYRRVPLYQTPDSEVSKMFNASSAYSTYSTTPVKITMPSADLKFEKDKCRYFFEDKTKENTTPEYFFSDVWFCRVGEDLVFYPCSQQTELGEYKNYIPLFRFYDDLGREVLTHYTGIPACSNGVYVIENVPSGIVSYSVDFYTEGIHAVEDMGNVDYKNSLRQMKYAFEWGSLTTPGGCDIFMRRVNPMSGFAGTIRLLECSLGDDGNLTDPNVVEMELSPNRSYTTKDFKPDKVYFYVN